jgi:hypothetical protein
MHRAIDKVLTAANIQPVLVDIGASGAPPPVWKPIARRAVYVGFDPDRRELHDVPDGAYARSVIVNQAVTDAPGRSDINFYLTHSPFCSSTLRPDTGSLSDYLFSDLFVVEREAAVPASTLGTVLAGLGIRTVDWFKTDSQGTDLRLFRSLPDDMRERVLAVDVEPGLIDAYQGEDLFVDAHREFLRQGFWLSSLAVKGSVRMRRATLAALSACRPALKESEICRAVQPSPGWCEARYLRTLGSLGGRDAGERDYLVLWVFALLDRQPGFALDLALDYRRVFGDGDNAAVLWEEPQRLMRQFTMRKAWASCKSLAPGALKRFVKAVANRA